MILFVHKRRQSGKLDVLIAASRFLYLNEQAAIFYTLLRPTQFTIISFLSAPQQNISLSSVS
jgi:hypothetical protein